MRTASIVIGSTVSLLLAPGVARAADHLMKVSEVFLDDGTGAQYVELNDNGEPLSGSYQLAVYDADGSSVGTPLALTMVAAQQGFYMIGNAAAVTAFDLNSAGENDATLTVILPTDGQAC